MSTFLKEFIAGNVGGVMGIVTVYPLDTIKIRIQTYPNLYKSSFDVIKRMHKKSGITSMYRGLLSPCLGFGFTFAVSFSSFGYFMRNFQSKRQTTIVHTTDLFLSGFLTGIIQSPFRSIMERVKSVMQVHEKNGNNSPYKWSGECFVHIIRNQGIVGLFQGFSSVMLREVPQFAIYYPTYHLSKEKYKAYGLSNTISELLAGGTAGIVQWLPPFYSFDVIKSHMQTCKSGQYRSIMDCAQSLYKRDGIKVFYRGLVPTLVRGFFLHSIIFYGYENTMRYLN